MLFNSFEFLVFIPLVFALYWFVFKQIKSQNVLILIASYFFYGWWDWRFLFLILASTIVDFSIGILLEKAEKKKKRLLLLNLSLLFNLGLLVYFKYYNFFIDNWIDLWSSLGIQMNRSSLNIILPVGISFYTFQTLSYTIDVYRNKLKPTKDFIAFASFVAFFPQLVAGPIERASNLLPQFSIKRKFDYDFAVTGMKLILWGLFKKVVIADNCALLVDHIFNDYQDQTGTNLILGSVFFAFQIYGDFSGYSDIAIGVARILGFRLMRNFSYPYFSRDIAEFWRRWHISLSTWFRDYLYIPLGGSRGSTFKKLRNVMAIFLVSGFWHGANWTFIAWGFINAVYFIPLLVLNKNRNHLQIVAENKLLPSIKESFQMLLTFGITCFAWIFFRSENIASAIEYSQLIVSSDVFLGVIKGKFLLLGLFLFVIVEWFSRKSEINVLLNTRFRHVFYIAFIFLIIYYSSSRDQTSFIYFQF